MIRIGRQLETDKWKVDDVLKTLKYSITNNI